jgi:uncharacterized protein
MNPSTAQILEAVEAANAEQVVILPNNKNIIAVAEQVDATTTKTVRVVPTKGIPEGVAALMAYDPDAEIDENLVALSEAARNVVAGEVTRAVRDSPATSDPSPKATTWGSPATGSSPWHPRRPRPRSACSSHLLEDDHEIVTLIEGEGSSDAETRRVLLWLEEHHGDVEAETHHGGQPLYPYFLGIE